MTHSISSSSSSSSASDPPISTSPPSAGCPFYQRSYVGGVASWAFSIISFFSDKRFEFAKKALCTEEPNIYKDYAWTSLPHSRQALFVTDPDIINKIVASKARDGKDFSGGVEFQYALTLGTGTASLLTITDLERKKMIAAFCRNNELGKAELQNLMPSIAEIAQNFVNTLSAEESYNMTETIPFYTLQQIQKNILKAEIDIPHAVKTIASVEKRISNFMLINIQNMIWTEVQTLLNGEGSFTALENIAEGIMNQSSANGIIQKMIADGRFNENEILSLTKTIIFIGSGTSNSFFLSLLYCLMRNPSIQEELFQDIKDFDLNNPDHAALYDLLNKHEGLKILFLETLRCFPPVPVQIRATKQEYIFKDKELTIPAGTSVYMPLQLSYTDKRRWPNPDKFDPSRFKKVPGNKTADIANKFKPFSDGNNKCAGEQFINISMKTLLCTIIQKYRIIAPPDMEEQLMEIEEGMTLKFNKPLFVQFEKRED